MRYTLCQGKSQREGFIFVFILYIFASQLSKLPLRYSCVKEGFFLIMRNTQETALIVQLKNIVEMGRIISYKGCGCLRR